MNRNLVGSIYMYGRFCTKFPQSRMKGERHRLSSFCLPSYYNVCMSIILNVKSKIYIAWPDSQNCPLLTFFSTLDLWVNFELMNLVQLIDLIALSWSHLHFQCVGNLISSFPEIFIFSCLNSVVNKSRISVLFWPFSNDILKCLILSLNCLLMLFLQK